MAVAKAVLPIKHTIYTGKATYMIPGWNRNQETKHDLGLKLLDVEEDVKIKYCHPNVYKHRPDLVKGLKEYEQKTAPRIFKEIQSILRIMNEFEKPPLEIDISNCPNYVKLTYEDENGKFNVFICCLEHNSWVCITKSNVPTEGIGHDKMLEKYLTRKCFSEEEKPKPKLKSVQETDLWKLINTKGIIDEFFK